VRQLQPPAAKSPPPLPLRSIVCPFFLFDGRVPAVKSLSIGTSFYRNVCLSERLDIPARVSGCDSAGLRTIPFASRLLLPTETKVESGTSQSKSGTYVNLRNSGKRAHLQVEATHQPRARDVRHCQLQYRLRLVSINCMPVFSI